MTDHRIRELFTQQPLGPWKAKVSITSTDVRRGRYSITPSDILYTVNAEWLGPPAHGARPSAVPVQASTCVVVPNYSVGLRVAEQAATELRSGRVPDLRAIARRSGLAAV
jgi:hypothetical protein